MDRKHFKITRSTAPNKLIAAALLVFTGSANARGALVWFEAVPGSPGASVVSQGALQTLQLGCDRNLGNDCFWDITVRLDTEPPRRLYGYSLDVAVRPENVGRVTVPGSVSFPVNALNQYTSGPSIQNGPNGKLLEFVNGLNTTGPVGTYDLFQFTLAMHQQPGEEPNTVSIYAGVGQAEFGGDDPGGNGYAFVRIGPNARRRGEWMYDPITQDTLLEVLPVIQIQNVPEPGTLGLFSFMVAGMVCRRKPTRR